MEMNMTDTNLQIPPETEKKMEFLKQALKNLGSAAIAFSSGVDSTFLLKMAHEVLGEHAVAITAKSDSFPKMIDKIA